jgi:hypothetical protein
MSSVLLEREAVLNVVKTRSQETCPHVGGVVLTKITLDTTVCIATLQATCTTDSPRLDIVP